MVIRLPFMKKNQKQHKKEDFDNIPEHVAIIMDGNGRWASEKGLPRVAGHKEGIEAVQKIVRSAVDHRIKILTLYAFSTENWKRPKPEVEFLMRLPKEFLHIYLPKLIDMNVKIATIGDFDSLPLHTQKAINFAKEQTAANDGLLLNFALNYGSRFEIMQAIKQVINDWDKGDVELDDIDEQIFSKYLYTDYIKDPDLLIRTSGEQRLSNFLLWQLAYTEFWFTDVLWPDFDEQLFAEAILDYQKRKRRYGGV